MRVDYSFVRRWIAVLSWSALTIVPTSAFGQVFVDHFDSGVINTNVWSPYATSGPGFRVAAASQRLEVSTGSGYGGAGLVTNASLSGDFDVQIDYSLLQWPSRNDHGVRLVLTDAGVGVSGGVAVLRYSSPDGKEGYAFAPLSGVAAGYIVETSDTGGGLRVVRTGSRLTSYFRTGAGWRSIGSADVVTTPTRISIEIGTAGSSAPSASAAFDNFVVNSGTVGTGTPAPCSTPLSAPSNLTFNRLNGGGGDVDLFWVAPTSGNPTSYVLEGGLSPGATSISFDTTSVVTSYQARRLAPGTYYVRVRAKNNCGVSAPSTERSFSVARSGPAPCSASPTPPSNLTYNISGSTVDLFWAASLGAESYILEAGSRSGSTDIAIQDTASTNTSFSATNVGTGLYYVRIRARNACGTSGPSTERQIQVGPVPTPVLLVHGFCSDSNTWGDMIASMQPSTRYGNGVTKLYAARDVRANQSLPMFVFQRDTGLLASTAFPSADPSKRVFTIDFYNDVSGSFAGDQVADTGILHKAAELSAVIKEVTRISGASKVTIVAHSLGGLATRAYVQGLAIASGPRLIHYGDDVAKIITIDTPHTGADPANWLSFAGQLVPCFLQPSVDKVELAPASSFLTLLNSGSTTIPSSIDVSAILSWSTNNGRAAGDLVVNYQQQSLATISPYNQVAYVSDLSNQITTPFVPPLHTVIHHLHQTTTLVQNLIASFDGVLPLGAPGGLTASAGASTVTLFWNAPTLGNSVGSYIVEVGSTAGAADRGSFDTTRTTTEFSFGPEPAGTYYLRIRAKGAAGGIGPPSNEVVVRLGTPHR